MADPEDTKRRKWRRYAVLFGVVLGVVCKSLPHEYQGPCDILMSICTGGY